MSEQNKPSISFIVHGTPHGCVFMDDPHAEYIRYACFHRAGDTNIDHPSSPGEKSITASLPSGTMAYTFVRTGVREATSDRPGSNYSAITLFVPTNFKVSDPQQLHQKLKQFFENNVLQKYTYGVPDGWLKWTSDWKGLFYHEKNIQALGTALNDAVVKPCITEQNKSVAENFSDGTQQIQQKIAELEKAIQAKEQELAQMRHNLQTLKNQK